MRLFGHVVLTLLTGGFWLLVLIIKFLIGERR